MSTLLRLFGPPSLEEMRAGTAEDNELAFWRLAIWCRHVSLVALVVASLTIPAVGDDRFVLALVLVVVGLPYNIALDIGLRRRQRVPVLMAFTDAGMAGLFPLIAPDAWVPILLVALAIVALGAVGFPRRIALAATVEITALLAITGGLTLPAEDVVIGVVALGIAAFTTVVAVGTVGEGERSLRRRVTDLIGDLEVVVWEAEASATRYTYLSDAASALTGYPLDDLHDVAFWFDHVHRDDRERAWGRRYDAIGTGTDHEDEYRMVCADGRIVWFHDVIRIERDGDDEAVRYRGVTIDVTDRKIAEEQVELYANIVERIHMALLVARVNETGDGLDVIAANPEASTIVGVPVDRVGQPIAEVMPHLSTAVLDRLLRVTESEEAFDMERLEGASADRSRVHALHAFPLPGRTVGICLDDVTGSALAAAALRRQALHDGLTGLPNRTLLRDRLEQALGQAGRQNDRVALMLMDLDHFKEVNDALGHRYGDRLLIEFARRLQDLLRECDTIARLGGDEFALLLTTNATGAGASRVVEKVRAALQEPFEIDGVTIQTNASIGVALFPDHADNAELLTQRADVAMYNAKRGGGGWAVYSPDHDRSSVERLTLLTELHRAIDENELSLHYQPVIDVRTRQAVSSEALIRWEHPSYGMLDPGLVIELAELSGLILPLARWVARDAISTLAGWLAEGRDLRVAINLSVRNLYDRKLVRWLSELLEEFDVAPERLKVELTESEIMDDPLLAIDVLGALNEIGVTTAIDDFGTGYSSLTYLRRLPVTEIKIDQSFVFGMTSGEHDYTIVRTVIDLAHNLGMSVLAEGVEDLETLQTLERLGCDRAQGYLMGKPAPASELLDTIDRWAVDVSTADPRH